ncbi:MAG: hypothetical protein ABI647_21010 [Gemmatimonadota bacterium]
MRVGRRDIRVRPPSLAWFTLVLAVTLGPPSSSAQDCNALDAVKFVCLSAGAEDLVAIPNSDWVILSGELRAVNTTNFSEVRLFPIARSRFDQTRYSSCPGPLTERDIANRKATAHGINLRAGPNGVHTLYVVHHPQRESVEVFEVDARGKTPTITWVGCVLSPAGVSGNSVAVLPNHGFALTNFLSRGLGGYRGEAGASVRAKLAGGEPTGEVWEWNPGQGWTKVPGSDGAGPNGLEASPDGRWFYIAEWGTQKVIKLSRGQPNPTKQEVSLDFHPDNLRWQSDGSLLAAGQHGTVDAILSDCLSNDDCRGVATSVASIDPVSLEAQELVHRYPANGYFAAGTTGLKVGNDIWVGSTYRGTRIARFGAK